jgi:hypothetical protein
MARKIASAMMTMSLSGEVNDEPHQVDADEAPGDSHDAALSAETELKATHYWLTLAARFGFDAADARLKEQYFEHVIVLATGGPGIADALTALAPLLTSTRRPARPAGVPLMAATGDEGPFIDAKTLRRLMPKVGILLAETRNGAH